MKKELIETIKKCTSELEDFDWTDYYRSLFCDDNNTWSVCYKELLKCGFKIDLVDHYGGEGQGSEYWSVFSVEHEGQTKFFRIDGYYASHYGAEITGDSYDFEEVEKVPVQTYEWKPKR
jgi:hypothetical protein